MSSTRKDAGTARAQAPDTITTRNDSAVRVLLAIARGETPEDVAGWLESGWPQKIEDLAADPATAAEMSQFVAILRHLESPAQALAA